MFLRFEILLPWLSKFFVARRDTPLGLSIGTVDTGSWNECFDL